MNNQNYFTMKKLIRVLQVCFLIIPISCYSQYISTTTTQIATTYVLQGSLNNPMIRVEITIGANAVVLSSILFTHDGCTNPGNDIANTGNGGVKVFNTGSSNIFSTGNLFGTYMGSSFPVASFNVNGQSTLNPGINYLWLTYDIYAGAVACDIVDAACISININGMSQTVMQSPFGYATITNCATSVNNIQIKNDFEIFLNSLNDELTIKTNNNEVAEILLYDISSNKLFQQKFIHSATVSTKQLAKGIYLYEVRNKNGVVKKGKVVKD